MTESRHCPECGAEIEPGAVGGHCPSCLLRIGLAVAGSTMGLKSDDPFPLGGSAASSFAAESSGRKIRSIGDYELIEEISHGGMGIVYKARHAGLNRVVALKLIRAGELANEAEVARFGAEAEAAANLDHPNIVPIYEVGEHEGRHYFSMKLVEGGTLSERITCPQSPLSNHDAAKLVVTVARAVHYAHQRGLLHRDLKPGNILLDREGQPHITDFGLAKRIDTDSAMTLLGVIVGTPSYISPEQAAGVKQLTTATDVHSLGAILYELLGGRPPFVGGTVMETLQKVMHEEPLAPSVVRSKLKRNTTNVDRDLETICLKCLAKEPARRYGSAEALADDLERWLAQEPIRARPVTFGERLHKWARRNPLLATGSVALFLAVGLGLSGIVWQWRRAEWAAHQTREQLWRSYLDQSRAERLTDAAGARQRALTAITNAAAIRVSVALRNEAIAALSLTDWADDVQFTNTPGSYVGAAFDTELRRAAVRTLAGELVLRNVEDGRELFRLPLGAASTDKFGFSPDARMLAIGMKDGQVALWDLATRSLRWSRNARRKPGGWPFVFHPREPLIALATGVEELKLVRIADGGDAGQLALPRVPSRMAFSPDGLRLAIAGGTVAEILDYPQSRSLGAVTNRAVISTLAWHPDGHHLALGAADDSGAITLWNTDTGATETWIGEPVFVATLVFDPRGALLASGHWNNLAQLWDTASGKRLSLRHRAVPQRFSADGNNVAWMAEDETFGRWSLSRAKHLRMLAVPLGSRSGSHVAFSPDGRSVAASEVDGLRLWDAVSAQLLVMVAERNKAFDMNFTHDGKWLLTTPLNQAREPNKFYRWPLATNAATGSLAIGAPEQIDATNIIVLDGKVGQNGLGHLFPADVHYVFGPGTRFADLRDPFQLYELRPVSDGVSFLSRTTNWIALCGSQLQIRRLGGATLKIPTEYQGGLALLSPDSTRLAHFTSSVLEMFATDTGHLLWSRAQEVGATGHWTFSHDGRLLVVASSLGAMIRLIDSANGEEVATLTPPVNRPVAGLAIGPDAQTLAVSHSRMILLWDLRSLRQQLRTLGLDWRDENPSGSFPPRQL